MSNSSTHSRWLLVIKLAVLAAVLCALAAISVFLYWRVRRDALLDRIRAAGDPVLPNDNPEQPLDIVWRLRLN